MRFRAPPRESIAPAVFDHPVFAGFAQHRDLLAGREWPALDTLNARLCGRAHPISGASLRFVAQTPELLADRLHYEQRIFERGEIATRVDNWHDLLNALIWIERLALKAAVNARYVVDLARVGPKTRTRAQCALTLFDEGGVVVLLRDPGLLEPWDAHDWHGLFWRNRAAWTTAPPRVEVIVFGHALLEHALAPCQTLVAKACVFLEKGVRAEKGVRVMFPADRLPIADRPVPENHSDPFDPFDPFFPFLLATDPQELRPLPLCGIPGWHPDTSRESFYREAPCFRPLRPGRVYPPPGKSGKGVRVMFPDDRFPIADRPLPENHSDPFSFLFPIGPS